MLTRDLALPSFGSRLSKLGQQYLSVTNLVVAHCIIHTEHITESYVSVCNFLRDPTEVDKIFPLKVWCVSSDSEMSEAPGAEHTLFSCQIT